MRWTLPLEELDGADVRRLGGKAAGLVRMVRSGLPVPPAVVLPVEAQSAFLEHNDLVNQARTLRHDDPPQASAWLRERIEAGAIPPELAGALRLDAGRLGDRLAVRSSAVDEDARDQSFAGQYLSRLNVAPGDELERAVKACWASWFGDRALAYRRRGLRKPPVAGMAVVVQRLVDARSAGVLFTINPLTGSWRQMVLEAVAGQGEALVGGAVAPDRYLLRRPRRTPRPVQRVLARVRVDEEHVEVAEQPRMLVPDAAGTLSWQPVAAPNERKLSRREARRIGRMGLRAEALAGAPQDLEWAIDAAGDLHLLQTRAITAAGEPAATGEVLWTRRFAGERWTEPASPMGWSLIGPLLDWFIAYPETSARFLGGAPPTRLHQGRPYFNVTVFRHLAFKLPGRPPPRFLLEFFPPEEEARWLARFAAAPDFRVYRGIFSETGRQRRWRRFRWNPLTNPVAWDGLLERLENGLPALERDEARGVQDVLTALDWVREYVKVHVCSLLYANILYQLVGHAVPPELAEDLLRCPVENKTQQTNRALHGLAHGAALEPFLERYGHRTSSSSWEVFSPRWAQHPERVWRLVEPYRQGGLEHPEERARKQRAAADAAIAELRRRTGPVEGRALVRAVQLTRRYLQLREDQRFTFDRLLYALQRIVVRLGEDSLGAGTGDEVRWLVWPELRDVAEGRIAPAAAWDLIAERRERHLKWAAEPAPPVFLAGDQAVDEVQGGSRLRGLGISPGRATGRVRIIRSPEEAERLHKGDVLVATATDPGWTPLFLVAGAAVLELGSMLSHGAVVAREYRLPAVANVAGATTTLREGQRVTVDGSRGLVFVEEG